MISFDEYEKKRNVLFTRFDCISNCDRKLFVHCRLHRSDVYQNCNITFLISTIESVYIKREKVCQIQVGLDARVDIFS